MFRPNSSSDEVIENTLSWIPVFFQLKLQPNDTHSRPLLPLNINSKVKSYLGLFLDCCSSSYKIDYYKDLEAIS